LLHRELTFNLEEKSLRTRLKERFALTLDKALERDKKGHWIFPKDLPKEVINDVNL